MSTLSLHISKIFWNLRLLNDFYFLSFCFFYKNIWKHQIFEQWKVTLCKKKLARFARQFTSTFQKTYIFFYLGKVLGYTIIATENIKDSTESTDLLPTWSTVQAYSVWPAYQVKGNIRWVDLYLLFIGRKSSSRFLFLKLRGKRGCSLRMEYISLSCPLSNNFGWLVKFMFNV